MINELELMMLTLKRVDRDHELKGRSNSSLADIGSSPVKTGVKVRDGEL